ncbi:MAG: hypothetical protein ACRBC3_11195 [Burkholderiaceae bacterium]
MSAEAQSTAAAVADLSRAGSVCAIATAAIYLIGFIILIGWLAPAGYADGNANLQEQVQLIVDNRIGLSLWYLLVYCLNGVLLIVLATALYYRFRPLAPGLALLSLIFGVVWAGLLLAAGLVASVGVTTVADFCRSSSAGCGEAWQAIQIVVNGLGGGNEITGAIWLLLVAAAGLRDASLPPSLIGLSGLLGLTGAVSAWPGLGEICGVIFGLGCIAWFVWIGLLLARALRTRLPSVPIPGRS